MTGIDRQRREHREDPLVVERRHSPCGRSCRARPTTRCGTPLCRQRRQELVDEDRLLTLDQPINAFADLDELLGGRPAVGLGSSMPAASWSFKAATRTPKNSSRLIEQIAQNLARSSSGMPGSEASDRTRSLKSSQLSSQTEESATSYPTLSRQQGCHTRCRSIRPSPSGRPSCHSREISSRSASRLIRSRLRRNCGSSPRKQHQPGERPGPEFVEHGAVAPVPEDLPVRRDRSEIDDTGVAPVVVGSTRSVISRRVYWRFRASSNASGHDEPVTAGTRAIPRTRLEPGVEPDRMVDTSLQLC